MVSFRENFEDRELNVGYGKIGAFVSISLGILSILGGLCFLFPSLFTTPELRPVYVKYYNVLYYSLLFFIILSASFGAFSAIIRNNKYGFYGLFFSITALILGCIISQNTKLVIFPFYSGLDYFIVELLVLGFIFIPLERKFSKNTDQKILRVGWVTDLKYFMFSHLGVQLVKFLTIMPVQYWVTHLHNNPIAPVVMAQPYWIQFIEILLLVDFVTYWVHRAMHEVPFLWRIHAIHHSTQEMDWLASSRLHLLEIVFTRFLDTFVIFLFGFHTTVVFCYLIFISFHAIFLHSNVRFRFPYIRWLIATPEFHHWHHSSEKPAIDKNYSAFIPLYDKVFKTVYMPNHLASRYGTVGYKIPNSFTKQFVWPFKKYIKKWKNRNMNLD